jgi:hypothetical protein
MEAEYISETMVTAYNITRYHKSVEHTLISNCLETNKSRSIKTVTALRFCTFSAPNFIILLILVIYIALLFHRFMYDSLFRYAAADPRKRSPTSLLSFFYPLLKTI